MSKKIAVTASISAAVAAAATFGGVHVWHDRQLTAEAASVELGPVLSRIHAASLRQAGWSFVERAKDQVAAQMRDPSSAQFRGLGALNPNALCGEVNGKNGFGAYVGFRLFYSDPRTGAVGVFDGEAPDHGSAFYADYARYCSGS